jgi:FdrA protein
MNTILVNEIRKGFYLDSVALMRLSRQVSGFPGVREAALMMATPANKAILWDAGLLHTRQIAAESNDLVIALKVESEALGRQALVEAMQGLQKPQLGTGEQASLRPRSIAAAIAALPGANLALISVPGSYAATEARKAMRRGLHVMMFSDNVSIEDELALKLEAREAGLLMMGPDCGTAILCGVPLGFANRLGRGDVGIIGASGTGIQEVSCLVSEGGGGISHAIGVGGRDLNSRVGGITTLMAIDALDHDQCTERVVLISKPPHPDVACTVIERIGRSPKPYTVCFIGSGPLDLPPNAAQALTLREAAESVLGERRVGAEFDMDRLLRDNQIARSGARLIAGMYAGGTLCVEAQFVLAAGGRKVASNAAISGTIALDSDEAAGCDRIIDFGADEYTRSKPHPMIDSSLRDAAVGHAIADPDVAVVLMDFVIGQGAHSDPAGHFASLAGRREQHAPAIVASVTGTEFDPQRRSVQARILRNAGILVAPSNAHA